MGEVKHGDGVTFYKVSSGKLKKQKRDENGTALKNEDGSNQYELLDGYEGRLLSIEKRENEFEGKKTMQVCVKMLDEESGKKAEIQFTDKTFFMQSFFSRLVNVDIEAPFIIGVMPSEQNAKMSFCYMKQFGKKIEKDASFPKADKIDENTYDWRKVTAKVDGIISEVNAFLGYKNPEDGDAKE